MNTMSLLKWIKQCCDHLIEHMFCCDDVFMCRAVS